MRSWLKYVLYEAVTIEHSNFIFDPLSLLVIFKTGMYNIVELKIGEKESSYNIKGFL